MIPIFIINHTATTEIYTLSLHDALPILIMFVYGGSNVTGYTADPVYDGANLAKAANAVVVTVDRKSTRLNSSHVSISYAVFCLKKKKSINKTQNLYNTYYTAVTAARTTR